MSSSGIPVSIASNNFSPNKIKRRVEDELYRYHRKSHYSRVRRKGLRRLDRSQKSRRTVARRLARNLQSGGRWFVLPRDQARRPHLAPLWPLHQDGAPPPGRIHLDVRRHQGRRVGRNRHPATARRPNRRDPPPRRRPRRRTRPSAQRRLDLDPQRPSRGPSRPPLRHQQHVGAGLQPSRRAEREFASTDYQRKTRTTLFTVVKGGQVPSFLGVRRQDTCPSARGRCSIRRRDAAPPKKRDSVPNVETPVSISTKPV